MLPRVCNHALCSLNPDTRENVALKLFRCHTGLYIIENALSEDPGAHDDPLAGDAARYAFNVGTVLPIDLVHGTPHGDKLSIDRAPRGPTSDANQKP
jgi:hypothetical protein